MHIHMVYDGLNSITSDAKWLLTGIYTLNKKVQYVKFLM